MGHVPAVMPSWYEVHETFAASRLVDRCAVLDVQFDDAESLSVENVWSLNWFVPDSIQM